MRQATIRAVLGLAALGLLAGSGGQARGNLVVNGSFEDNPIGSPFVSTNVALVTGWTHTGSNGDGPIWHVGYADGDGSVTVAGQGQQFVTMGGGFDAAGSASWSQVLHGLTVGTTYNLSFEMAAEANFSGPQSLTVSFPTGSTTGSQVFTAATPPSNYWSDWETKTMNFVATASDATLMFSVVNAEFDVGLDNVQVNAASNATPEPSTLLLGGLGMAFGLLARRRRRPSAA
jgi:hypothetical protein